MKKIFAVMAVVGIIGMGGPVVAGDAKSKEVAAAAVADKTMVIEKFQIFTGTVQKSEKHIVLSSGGKTYILGGTNLEKIVGKKVSISGTLVKGKTVDTIIVEQAQVTG